MSWDWVEFRNVGADWDREARKAGTQPSEALFRSAASRAYYSVFNAVLREAEASATHQFVDAKEASKHRALILHLEGSTDIDVRQIGVALRGIRGLRNTSDYDDEIATKTVGYGRRKRSLPVAPSWEALSKTVLDETSRILGLLNASTL